MSPGDFLNEFSLCGSCVVCLILFLNALDGGFIILYEFTIIIYDLRIFSSNIMIFVGGMR